MIDKTGSQPLQPTVKPKAPPAPPAPSAEQVAGPATTGTTTVAKDETRVGGNGASSGMTLTGKQEDLNPLDAKDSKPRAIADAGSNVVTGVEAANDARGIAGIATTVGTRVSRLGRLTSGLASGLTKVADFGADIASRAPMLGRAFAGVAKAAPLIGVGMAALDIGKAALENDPEKKQIAKGTAALSTFSAAAGIAGAALLVPPATAVGVGLIAAGIGASVFSFVDTTFLGGKASKAIGNGMDAVADGAKAVGGVVADGAKKVWGAISSL